MSIQDSIGAFQAPRDSNDVHNRAVREIFTPTWGDEMTVANDGTFSMTYTYQVPDTIGKFATVLKNMEVQAFVTNYNTSVNKREVQNATKIALLPEETILPNE